MSFPSIPTMPSMGGLRRAVQTPVGGGGGAGGNITIGDPDADIVLGDPAASIVIGDPTP